MRETEIAILKARKRANIKKELVLKEEINSKIESVDVKATTAIELSNKVIDSLKETNHALEVIKELPIKTIEGKPGEDGYTPVKDVDYFDGNDGYTPVKGKDYFDGKNGKTPKKGEDYFTPEEVKQFKKEVTPKKGKDYDDGKDGSPDTPHEIRNKLSTLRGRERLDAKHIQNIDKYVSLSVTQTMGGGQGGGSSYTLPTASPTVLGGIKIGDRITIDANGVLSADVQTGATGVQSVVSGNDIAIDNTDPVNPVVSFIGTIPTDTNQLTNGAGFITAETDPVWESEKVNYATKSFAIAMSVAL